MKTTNDSGVPSEKKVTPEKVAEFAHDLQTGLAQTHVSQFDRLPIIGMASIISLHIRGLGEIKYDVLRQVADYFFDVPSSALPEVLRVLEEIGYVQLISKSPTSIQAVIPQVPHFRSIHEGLGKYVASVQLTEHEQLSVAILNELTSKAEKRDALLTKLGAEKSAFNSCENIVSVGGLVISKRVRGHSILVSPAYFADNLDALADLAASGSSPRLARLLELFRQAQGWPLSLIETTMEVGGSKITAEELTLVRSMLADGILKPPSIERPGAAELHFVFTPRPGSARLDVSKREIYERAMALVAAVRKGQLLPELIKIRSPIAILTALRDRKKLGANTDAKLQYGNLVALRVGRLVKAQGSKYEFHLIDNEENIEAVQEAISLLSVGQATSSNVRGEARLALTQDEKYIQSIVSAAKLKKTGTIPLGPEEREEIEQLLLNLK